MIDPNEEEPINNEPSKSAIKREMTALQKMGEALVKLSEAQLAQITLPEKLLQAVLEAKRLTHNEAKRRQAQYIGKLMRNVDVTEISLALKRFENNNAKHTQQFHHTEKWREDLIVKGDEGLQEFMALYPEADRQTLRQLIRKAQHDRKNNKNTGGEKSLFKYLSDYIS